MVKVLEVFGEPISSGGQESFAVNTILHMDRGGLKIDWLTPYYCDNAYYRDLIKGMGGNVFCFDLEFAPGKSRFDVYQPLKKFLKSNKYDIVHVHSGSESILAIVSLVSKLCGVKKIIVHSHCAAEHKDVKHYIAKYLCMPILASCPTDYCACSQVAGEWKFSRFIARNKMMILKNGVDLERFAYNRNMNQKIRDKLGIRMDAFVVGHVGRFSYQKNHEFLIDIFNEILKQKNNCRLLLIGNGEEMQKITEKVSHLKLTDSVIFCGSVNDVQDYMSVMDVFVLPSRYEGLPIVGVEAQAAGMPLVTSTNVSEEVKLIKEVEFLSLDKPAEEWARVILEYCGCPRVESAPFIYEKGYDVHQTAGKLRELYIGK